MAEAASTLQACSAWRRSFPLLVVVAIAVLSCGSSARAPGNAHAFIGHIDYRTSIGNQVSRCVVQERRIACAARDESADITLFSAVDDESRRYCTLFAPGPRASMHGRANPIVSAYDGPEQKSAEASEGFAAVTRAMAHGAFSRTGKRMIVAGRACDEWQADGPTVGWTACVDDTLVLDIHASSSGGVALLWHNDLPPGLPLYVGLTPRDVSARVVVEVTRVELGTPRDAEFADCPTR